MQGKGIRVRSEVSARANKGVLGWWCRLMPFESQNPNLKIAIVGSRDLPEEWVLPRLNFLLDEKNFGKVSVISGGARGVDTFVERYCKSWNIPIEVIRPTNTKDKYSYLLRNIKIVERADLILAFWDGQSKGT